MINFDIDITKVKRKENEVTIEIYFKGKVLTIQTGKIVKYDYIVTDGYLVVMSCMDCEVVKVTPVNSVGEIVDRILESL